VVFGQVAAGLTHHPARRAFDGLTASGAEEEVILERREGRAFLCRRHGDVVYEGHEREGRERIEGEGRESGTLRQAMMIKVVLLAPPRQFGELNPNPYIP
jgi:hypothetical protein